MPFVIEKIQLHLLPSGILQMYMKLAFNQKLKPERNDDLVPACQLRQASTSKQSLKFDSHNLKFGVHLKERHYWTCYRK